MFLIFIEGESIVLEVLLSLIPIQRDRDRDKHRESQKVRQSESQRDLECTGMGDRSGTPGAVCFFFSLNKFPHFTFFFLH
jgi:hypothetical protein